MVSAAHQWHTLSYSLLFLLKKKRLLGWSIILFLATVGFTAAGYEASTSYIDGIAGTWFSSVPDPSTTLGWVQHKLFFLGKFLFTVVSRIISFYLAFLLAYCLTSPGYAFLSTATEKLHAGQYFEDDGGLTPLSVLLDIYEAIKIGCFGIVVTVLALLVNFVPVVGQATVFLLYTFYSALLFIDYPASRRRWSLGRKINWLREHSSSAFRLGLFPALVSLVPLLNVFLMSLLFPLLTVHATLNFSAIELANKLSAGPTGAAATANRRSSQRGSGN